MAKLDTKEIEKIIHNLRLLTRNIHEINARIAEEEADYINNTLKGITQTTYNFQNAQTTVDKSHFLI